MKSINNFSILNKMCDRNDTSIKLYSGNTNFIDANLGKNDWGNINMAVDNNTIMDTASNKRLGIALLIYDLDVFDQVKKEMEK